MNTRLKKTNKQYALTPSQKKTVEKAAKKIVKEYGKTLQLLAKE